MPGGGSGSPHDRTKRLSSSTLSSADSATLHHWSTTTAATVAWSNDHMSISSTPSHSTAGAVHLPGEPLDAAETSWLLLEDPPADSLCSLMQTAWDDHYVAGLPTDGLSLDALGMTTVVDTALPWDTDSTHLASFPVNHANDFPCNRAMSNPGIPHPRTSTPGTQFRIGRAVLEPICGPETPPVSQEVMKRILERRRKLGKSLPVQASPPPPQPPVQPLAAPQSPPRSQGRVAGASSRTQPSSNFTRRKVPPAPSQRHSSMPAATTPLEKPSISYSTLIVQALSSSPRGLLTVSEIYKWVEDAYPYYRHIAPPGWKNSIRHNLSLKKAFLNYRNSDRPGSFWTVDPDLLRTYELKGSIPAGSAAAMMEKARKIRNSHSLRQPPPRNSTQGFPFADPTYIMENPALYSCPPSGASHSHCHVRSLAPAPFHALHPLVPVQETWNAFVCPNLSHTAPHSDPSLAPHIHRNRAPMPQQRSRSTASYSSAGTLNSTLSESSLAQ